MFGEEIVDLRHRCEAPCKDPPQSDDERTLTGTPSGSATNEEGASGSLGVLWSEEASSSAEVPAPTTAAASASSKEADSLESTPGSPAHALTPVTDQPNR